MSNKNLRAAVIGAGVMGRNHARVMSAMPGIDLVCVVDASADNREAVAAQFGCEARADLAGIGDLQLDYAVVAVPNQWHEEVTIALLDAGIHVLVEKPIAPTAEAARRMIDRAAQVGRQLMVGHVERFNPAVLAAKAALNGAHPASVTITRVGPFPPRMSDVGVVIDLAVHDIDIIRAVTGSEIAAISAQMTSVKAQREDTALLQFKTENGVLAHINTNWITPFKLRELRIATDQKFIIADLLTRQVSEYSAYAADGSFTMRQIGVPSKEPLVAEHEAFANAIRSGQSSPVTGEDGLKNLEVALACLKDGGF